MTDDVASMWLHFACFSSKIFFFCGPLNFQIHLSRFLIPGSVWLEYFVICKVRVDENFTLLLYLLLYTYLTLFRKIDFSLVLEGKSSPCNIFTIIWNLSPALINSLYVIVSWTLTDLQFKYSLI